MSSKKFNNNLKLVQGPAHSVLHGAAVMSPEGQATHRGVLQKQQVESKPKCASLRGMLSERRRSHRCLRVYGTMTPCPSWSGNESFLYSFQQHYLSKALQHAVDTRGIVVLHCIHVSRSDSENRRTPVTPVSALLMRTRERHSNRSL